MAHPYHHALSSVKKWGGTVDDYQAIHAWYDSSKAHSADFRHRAMFHPREFGFLRPSSVRRSRCRPAGSFRPDGWASSMSARILASFRASPTGSRRSGQNPGWAAQRRSRRWSIRIWRRRSWRSADMSRAYLNLGVSPGITPLAMLRVAIGRLHPDTLAVRSWRPARKRYYRELLQAHAEAQLRARVACE